MKQILSSTVIILVLSTLALFSLAHASTPVIPPIVDGSALKESVNPCQNFYQFSCGGWLDASVIPSDRSSVNRQSTALLDSTDEVLNGILRSYSGDSTAPHFSKTQYAEQLAGYYQSCLRADESTSQMLPQFKKTLRMIDTIQDAHTLAQVVAKLHLLGADVLFSFASGQDLNDSTKVIGFVDKGGMGLPDRKYYVEKDPKYVGLLKKYEQHIQRTYQLIGVSARLAARRAQAIVALEGALAEKAYSREESFDPTRINHPIGRSGLQKIAPHFEWDTYFKEMGVPELQALNVSEPEFFENLDVLLKKGSMSGLRTYLKWQYALRSFSQLGDRFEKEHFRFWNQIFAGQKQPLPRWKQCTQIVEKRLGYALAEAYVSSIDGVAIKEKATQYSVLIRDTFAKELEALTWLDQATLNEAKEKLALLGMKIGAPDKFRNYDALKVSRSSFLQNDQNIAAFETKRDLAKIGKPFDKSEWGMMPWEVNAYYDPPNNEFVFPFGILQPPSFDIHANDAVNLGSFGGGTVGHELTHGFDHDGHQYDGTGNIRNWWTPSVSEKFDQKNECYVQQANQYKVADVDMFVNGKLTLTEVVADNGGVKLGYLALQALRSNRPEAAAWLGKYTENQQFWIGYAQSWCTKRTAESLRNLITSNEHAPEEFRVNGVMMNMEAFAHDFGCAAGAPMAPVNHCSLW